MKEKIKSQNLKAVIYARYSSDNQREESIDGQLRECMEYAKHNDVTIATTYIDRALSAKTDHRPEFQRMIRDSAKQCFDLVIVWKLDRFSRDRYDSAYYKRMLKKNNVKVVSAKESISDGSEGILLEAMLEGYAEYYSRELAEKVLRGMTENALKFRANGVRTFGYYVDNDQQFQVDRTAATIVAEVFDWYADGKRMKEIMDILNARGVQTCYGKPFSLNIITRMLSNRKYIGEYKFADVCIPDAVEPIVSKEVFDKVQEMLAKNKKAPARHKAEDDYLLTTKLFCGKCGAFMVGESGTSNTGVVHHYYKCVNTKKHKNCDKKTIKKLLIENGVIKKIMKLLSDDNTIERLAESLYNLQSQESTKIPRLKEQLDETKKRIANLIEAVEKGFFSDSSKKRLQELEETKKRLELNILEEQIRKPLLTQEQIAFGIYKFRKLDLSTKEGKQRLIDGFINAIYLYDDKVIVTCNYREGTITVTLDELLGSDFNSSGAPKSVKV